MIWKVLKNRSNDISNNEIRIRLELPVCYVVQVNCHENYNLGILMDLKNQKKH